MISLSRRTGTLQEDAAGQSGTALPSRDEPFRLNRADVPKQTKRTD